MNPSSSETPAPEALQAVVVELKRHGAIVKLPSGSEAWLPTAEYKPEIGPKTDFRTASGLAVGNKLEVVVYEEPFRHEGASRVFVSHRRANKNDPWNKVANWDGQTVKVIEVRLVTAKHVVGSIEPGIHAEVLLDGLKPLFPPHWQDFACIVPGDKLAGFVRGKDPARWMVMLNVASYIQSEVRVEEAFGPVLSSASSQVNSHPLGDTTPPNHRTSLPVKRLLVVDNDLSFGNDIKSYLAAYGCEVVACPDSQQAMAALEGSPNPFDLALVDIHLTGIADFSGLGLAATMQEQFPDLPVVLITADDNAAIHPNLALRDDLTVCDLILKPIGTDDLWRAVAAQNKKPHKLRDLLRSTPQTGSHVVSSRPSKGEGIEIVLRELADEVKAEAAILFSIHPDSMRVSIEGSHDPHGLVPSVKPNIERSPINDVAIEGEEVYAAYASGRPEYAKHRWLQKAYRYRSCLAAPVNVKSEFAYGLFCFHRDKEAFRPEQMTRVGQAALVLGSLLHAQRLESMLAEKEPYELLGKAYGSMAHDLKEALSVGLNLDTLVELLQRTGSPSPEEAGELAPGCHYACEPLAPGRRDSKNLSGRGAWRKGVREGDNTMRSAGLSR